MANEDQLFMTNFKFYVICFILSIATAVSELITGRPPSFSHVDQVKFLVSEGSRFTLKCPLLDRKLDLEWYKDDEPINRHTLNLTIPTVSRIDSGIYRCYAHNGIGGAFSPSFNVTVSYLDGFVEKSEAFYQNKLSGQSGFITLQPPDLIGQGLEDVKWKWFNDNQEIQSSNNFFITKSGELVILETNNSTGQYRLEAITKKSRAYSKDYTFQPDLESIFPVQQPTLAIVYEPRDVQVVSGHKPTAQAVFECVPKLWTSSTKFADVEIRWLLNNNEITHDNRVETELGGRRLIIQDVVGLVGKGVHSAVVKCEAKTSDGLYKEHAHALLDVLGRTPKIDKENFREEVSKNLGEKVKLVCKDDFAWPRSKFTWYFNNKKLPTTSNFIRIESIQQKDYGVYQCEANNQAGSDIAHIWLRADSEDAIAQTRSVSIIEAPTSDPDHSSVTWQFNGIELNDIPHYLVNSTSLTINSVNKSDAGKYLCTVKSTTNGYKLASASAKVSVIDTKLIESGPVNQSLLIGSNVQMPCKISDDYAHQTDVKLTWFRNNNEIPEIGDVQRRISINEDGSLWINQVGPDNIGVYKCRAVVKTSNLPEQKEEVTAWFKIIEKPSMPQAVRVELLNETLPVKIRVFWDPGFDGNSPIIKYSVEMRTFGAQALWSEWTLSKDVPQESCCSTLVENLKASATTQFRVTAHNRFGAGKSSLPSQNITIPQQPPAAAPRQVAASARSSSSIMVQWKPPPSEEWNGDIKGYLIRYRLSGYASADWNEKILLKKPLITWREYDVQVAAYNNRGTGVFSKIMEVTTLEGVPMQAPQNVQVDVLNSTDILVSFDPPEQQMIPGVNLGYKIELWKGGFVLGQQPFRVIRVFPSSRISEHIGSLQKFGHYNLTVLCFTSPGDGPRSDPLEVVTFEDVPGPVASIIFDQVMSNSVVVQWEPPAQANGVILKYIIRHWQNKDDTDEKHKIEVSPEELSLTIDHLTASTRYSVDIQAVTKAGSGELTEASFESGITPELPGRVTQLSVSDVDARTALLQFVPGFDGHSFIRKWIVEAKIGSSSIFTAMFNTSLPKARSFTIDNLRPFTEYQLRIIAENVRGRGAPSDPSRPFKTLQTSPEKAPEKVYAEPISSNQVLLNWTPLISSYWNGEPVGYVILYRSASSLAPTSQEKALEQRERRQNKDNLGIWKELSVLSPKANEYTLTGLIPFTSYQIKMAAKNAGGVSAYSEMVIATTYESVPSLAPPNVIAEADQQEPLVRVSWQALDELAANGIITGYTVRVVPQEDKLKQEFSETVEIEDADTHSAVVSRLKPATHFHVWVTALTIVGEGPGNEPILVETPEMVPGKPSNVSFSFKSGKEVKLSWDPPTNPNGQILNYYSWHWLANQTEVDATEEAPIPSYIRQELHGNGAERRLFVKTDARDPPLPTPSIPFRDLTKAQSSNSIHLQWIGQQVLNELGQLKDNEAPVRSVSLEYQMANQNEWQRLPFLVDGETSEVTVNSLMPNTAYRARIRFIGDSAKSTWSEESDWIKTLEAVPSEAPSILQAKPYESSSLLVKWATLSGSKWNSDKIIYQIVYRIYPSNDSYTVEEIKDRDEEQQVELEHVVRKLSSFHHYVVHPLFVYVGYSIPKQAIKNLIAESISSSSIRLSWDKWLANDDDLISGYRIRYAPLLSTLSPEIRAEANNQGDSTEEVIITEKNEHTLVDLRKFTDYQISVAGYNRAGEGQASVIRQKTIEDCPGPLGSSSAAQRHHLGYVVNYKTYKLDDEFRKEVQEKSRINYLLAGNLEENVTYYFNVKAETSAGLGLTPATGNVTTGYNLGSPESPERPAVIPEQSTFLVKWKDNAAGSYSIKGHLIQAKRIATTVEKQPMNFVKRQKREVDIAEFRPRHVIGEWFTISNVIGSIETEHRISYRQLEPASFYIFRLFARNHIGVGKSSAESEQLHVPASLPEDPFYTKWWFLVIIGLLILIVIMVFVATLCFTNTTKKYKSEKDHAFDTLQLSDGGIASYALHTTKQTRKNEELSRPNTHTSWVSTTPAVLRGDFNAGGGGGYGSIASADGGGTPANPAISMYHALATDALPIDQSSHHLHPDGSIPDLYSAAAAYSSRHNLATERKPPSIRPETPPYQLKTLTLLDSLGEPVLQTMDTGPACLIKAIWMTVRMKKLKRYSRPTTSPTLMMKLTELPGEGLEDKRNRVNSRGELRLNPGNLLDLPHKELVK
uniref:Protein sidekick-like protein n=1 Tax=Ditylenchus dipsaci TaxID=166011 RepID=A0A915E8P4_9BILA